MRKSLAWMCMLVMAVTLVAVSAMAQDNMPGPPKVLNITREEVKAGKTMLHEQHEAAWLQAFLKAKYNTPMLTVSSVTGPTEDWFIVGYDSFAALEKDNEQMAKNAAYRSINMTYGTKDGDFISDSRTITARFRPDLSYKPGVNIGEYKYFSINVVRFRIGEDVDAFYKALNSAREKGGLDAHIAIYQVNSGMPGGTYLSFSPIKSMGEWDTPPNEAYQAALKDINFNQMAGKAVLNVESRLYAFSPEMSNPTKQMVASNPEFWKTKPVMANKAAATGEVTPAARKDTKVPEKK
jgi:hypothetical protein